MNHFWTTPFFRRALFLFLLLGLLVAITMMTGVRDELDKVVAWGEELIKRRPTTGMIAFVLFCAISAIAAFFSATILLPVAIQAWGQWPTFCLVALGWLIGGILSYLIGRYPGRHVFQWILPK